MFFSSYSSPARRPHSTKLFHVVSSKSCNAPCAYACEWNQFLWILFIQVFIDCTTHIHWHLCSHYHTCRCEKISLSCHEFFPLLLFSVYFFKIHLLLLLFYRSSFLLIHDLNLLKVRILLLLFYKHSVRYKCKCIVEL